MGGVGHVVVVLVVVVEEVVEVVVVQEFGVDATFNFSFLSFVRARAFHGSLAVLAVLAVLALPSQHWWHIAEPKFDQAG
jgi:hypothetical protein